MTSTPEDEDAAEPALRHFVIDPAQAGQRLDKTLVALCPDQSRTRLQGLIDSGAVMLEGKPCRQSSARVGAGQSLTLTIPDPVSAIPQPEGIPLHIVYEDSDLLVIDKPAGLVVHPGAGHHNGTLVNALLHHCGDSLSGIGGVIRPGIVHRLDRETSGLMVAAKNDTAHRGLSAQLADRSLSRTYLAAVWKVPAPKGVIDKPIARHRTNRQRMQIPFQADAPGSRAARTQYRCIHAYAQAAALVECSLETGRTHQIRVHMESIGHPLLGDPVYGLQKTAQKSLLNAAGYTAEAQTAIMAFPRQALHAVRLRFIHPQTGAEMGFDSPLPHDFTELISVLNQGIEN